MFGFDVDSAKLGSKRSEITLERNAEVTGRCGSRHVESITQMSQQKLGEFFAAIAAFIERRNSMLNQGKIKPLLQASAQFVGGIGKKLTDKLKGGLQIVH
ncbi:hypothetical protein IPC102_15395 [Pseudomonas aeruginosa]|nr:hypothetical protein IPC102_15395 [Pseudomonas aeruginosa]